MPQWRKLHTKTVESLDLDAMPDDFTRLTWVFLPLVSCREGRGLYNLSWLKSRLFPLRSDVSPELLQTAFGVFQELDMVFLYQVGNRTYYKINNWHTYQGSTDKEADSPYPDPSTGEKLSYSRVTPELLQTNSVTDADADADKEEKKIIVSKKHEEKEFDLFDVRWDEVLNMWKDNFPEKPQPQRSNKSLRAKMRTRLKDKDFRLNYIDALLRASQSDFLRDGGFFTVDWFLKNDENWRKCLAGNYDNPKGGNKLSAPSEPKGFAAARKILQEIENGNA